MWPNQWFRGQKYAGYKPHLSSRHGWVLGSRCSAIIKSNNKSLWKTSGSLSEVTMLSVLSTGSYNMTSLKWFRCQKYASYKYLDPGLAPSLSRTTSHYEIHLQACTIWGNHATMGLVKSSSIHRQEAKLSKELLIKSEENELNESTCSKFPSISRAIACLTFVAFRKNFEALSQRQNKFDLPDISLLIATCSSKIQWPGRLFFQEEVTCITIQLCSVTCIN